MANRATAKVEIKPKAIKVSKGDIGVSKLFKKLLTLLVLTVHRSRKI